jgi:hypothetical protein
MIWIIVPLVLSALFIGYKIGYEEGYSNANAELREERE